MKKTFPILCIALCLVISLFLPSKAPAPETTIPPTTIPPTTIPPCDPDPATPGYWHRQCLGIPASEGGIDPGRNGRGPSAPTEPGFVEELMPCAEDTLLEVLGFFVGTCEGIDTDPPKDPCERAIRQLTALILNVCSDRLTVACEVDATDVGCGSTDVGTLIEEVADLINAGECKQAADCAGLINEGYGLIY